MKKNNKFFRGTSTALTLILALSLSLGGCGDKNSAALGGSSNETSEAASAEAVPAKAEAPQERMSIFEVADEESGDTEETANTDNSSEEPVYNDSLIEEYITEEGDESENCIRAYSYHLPRIKGDTDGIRIINEEIDNYFGSVARIEMEEMADGGLCYYTDIGYESHWKGSLLSLAISIENINGGSETRVYSYDFASGKRLDNEDVLELLGMDKEEFLLAARRTVARIYDERQSKPADEEELADYYRNCGGDRSLLSLRADSIAAVGIDDAVIIPDGDGCQYMAPVQMYLEGGPEMIYIMSELETIPKDCMKMTVKDDTFTARLENDRVYLKFNNTAKTKDMLYSYDGNTNDGISAPLSLKKIEAGEEFEIRGLYSNYKDMFIVKAGYGDECYPYLFLVTELDTLEYVDVRGCGYYDVFCAMPCPGKFEGCTFESGLSGLDGGLKTVYAVNRSGKRYDLMLLIREADNVFPSGYWYSDEEDQPGKRRKYNSVTWQIDQDYGISLCIEETDKSTSVYNGYMGALGLTDEGIVCRYGLMQDFEEQFYGTFVYCNYTDYFGIHYYPIRMIFLTGTPPYGEVGETCLLFTGAG